MDKFHYECLVVGGGPGGSCAARAAAQAGLKTLMIEKRQEIGTPVRCGEGIATAWLNQIGVKPAGDWIANEVDGARIDPALHLFEPVGLAVEAPGGVKLGAHGLPDALLQVLRNRHPGNPLDNQPLEQRIEIVVAKGLADRRRTRPDRQRQPAQVGRIIAARIVTKRRHVERHLIVVHIADAGIHQQHVANGQRIKASAENTSSRGLPDWLDVDAKAMKGTFKALPQRPELSSSINESLIIELYSK